MVDVGVDCMLCLKGQPVTALSDSSDAKPANSRTQVFKHGIGMPHLLRPLNQHTEAMVAVMLTRRGKTSRSQSCTRGPLFRANVTAKLYI